ncbi:hypothetical protein MLD38_023503 [Melastoma candidum]|uniref:Uncharacterized protein n=1 Tax=Melastoma candidum TaxID=119954 RepID=A0ACB9NPN6_9MYRT|nr:hypothetical protein MLD38_023503 [Melastoma candidum]
MRLEKFWFFFLRLIPLILPPSSSHSHSPSSSPSKLTLAAIVFVSAALALLSLALALFRFLRSRLGLHGEAKGFERDPASVGVYMGNRRAHGEADGTTEDEDEFYSLRVSLEPC